MFERKAEAREFFGFSREEAVSSACAYFGKDAASLQIVDLQEVEIAGLAGRKGILARQIRAEGELAQEPRASRDGGESRRRHEDREPREREPREERDRKPRKERSRDRDRKRERDERKPESERAASFEAEADEESCSDRAPKAEPTSAPKVDSTRAPAGGDEELCESAEFVAGLIEHMKLGTFDINEKEDGKLLVVALSGPAIKKLIENGGGRVLDSIQFLANQAELRRAGDDARKIVIEAEGNEDKQQEYLEKLAMRAAKKAEETGKSIALDPMNSRDRRMVHVALKGMQDIATMSVGEGNYRRVVVVPKGAPEYEEALKSD